MRRYRISYCLLLFAGLLIWHEAFASSQVKSKRLPPARVGVPYEYSLAVTGLIEPVTFKWSPNEQHAWLTFDGPFLVGTPDAPTSKPLLVKVSVKDAIGQELTIQLSLEVRPALAPLSIDTKTLPLLYVDDPVNMSISATGGEGTYRWQEGKVTLPPGLKLVSNPEGSICLLSGKPKAPGAIKLNLSVYDAAGHKAGPVELTGNVYEHPPGKLRTDQPFKKPLVYGVAFTEPLTATGAPPPINGVFNGGVAGNRSGSVLITKRIIFTEGLIRSKNSCWTCMCGMQPAVKRN